MRFNSKWFKVYPWHSINIIPQWGCIPLCSDDPPYESKESLIEFVLFGVVVHIIVPYKIPSMGSRLIGPVWSKRRKMWY